MRRLSVLCCALWLYAAAAGAEGRDPADDRAAYFSIGEGKGDYPWCQEVLSPGEEFGVVFTLAPPRRNDRRASPDLFVYMMDTHTGSMSKIHECSAYVSAVWSPDGKSVAIFDDSARNANWCVFTTKGEKAFDFADSVRKAPEQYHEFLLVRGPFEASWLVDGRLEVVGKPTSPCLPRVKMLFEPGKGLTEAGAAQAASKEGGLGHVPERGLWGRKHGDLARRLGKGRGGLGDGADAVLSPAGRFSVFCVPDPTCRDPHQDVRVKLVYMMNLQTGEAQRIHFFAVAARASWSPDGDRVSIMDEVNCEPNWCVYSTDGTKLADFLNGIQKDPHGRESYPCAYDDFWFPKDVRWLGNNRLEIVAERRYVPDSVPVKMRIEIGRGLIAAWEIPRAGRAKSGADKDEQPGPRPARLPKKP